MKELGCVFEVSERFLQDMSGETGETFVKNQLKKALLDGINKHFDELPIVLKELKDPITMNIKYRVEIVFMTRHEYLELTRGRG